LNGVQTVVFTFRRPQVAFFLHRREVYAAPARSGENPRSCGGVFATVDKRDSVAHQRGCVGRMGGVARWQSIGKPTETTY